MYFNVLCMNPSQVTGGSGRLYTCFVSCHYCPCPAFTYAVLCRNIGLLVNLISCAILKTCLIWPWEKKKQIHAIFAYSKVVPNQTWDKNYIVYKCSLLWIILLSWSKYREGPCSLEDAAKTSVRNWAVQHNMEPWWRQMFLCRHRNDESFYYRRSCCWLFIVCVKAPRFQMWILWSSPLLQWKYDTLVYESY